MSLTEQTVAGSFDSRADARAAIEALRAHGVETERIGVLSRTAEGDSTSDSGDNSAWETGVLLGAGVGAAAGAGVGLALAATLLPGVGPVLAGGLLVSALGGAGSGAVAGGTLGGLMGLGVSEEDARYFDREFAAGRTIVAVRTEGPAEPLLEILCRHNARDRHVAEVPPTTGAGVSSGQETLG